MRFSLNTDRAELESRSTTGPGFDSEGEMATKGKLAAGQQVRFVFNYHECHAPDVPPEGWEDQEFLRQLQDRDWEQQGSAKNDLSDYCDPEIESLDELMDRVRQYFVDEEDQPDEVVQIPFDKLAVLMSRGSWSFVGGGFMEFEGNHNDSEITVVLKPKASRSRTVKQRK
jgi:hypothetical protein